MKTFLKIITTVLILIVSVAIIGYGGLMILGWMICGGGLDSGALFIAFLIFIGIIWANMALFKFLFKDKGKDNNENEEVVLVENKMLVDFIEKSMKDGKSKDQIKLELIQGGGWSVDEVDNAFKITG